jgi:acyl-coenzyme A synthetase/AMP-(fatty) acid ligase
MAELPRTPSGKIRKFELRDMLRPEPAKRDGGAP